MAKLMNNTLMALVYKVDCANAAGEVVSVSSIHTN